MSKERRYQDHEIRQILDLAIGEEDGPGQSLPAVDGLTLLELQEVGREVGLLPERITQAVAAFEGRGESDDPGSRLAVPAFFSLLGGSLVAGSAISLPRWARKQEDRMEHISRRAVSLLSSPASPDD